MDICVHYKSAHAAWEPKLCGCTDLFFAPLTLTRDLGNIGAHTMVNW